MKTINGELCYTSGEVAQLLGVGYHIVNTWAVVSDWIEHQGEERLIPPTIQQHIKYYPAKYMKQYEECRDRKNDGKIERWKHWKKKRASQ